MTDADFQDTAWVRLPHLDLVAARTPADHPRNVGRPTGMGLLLAAHPRIGQAFTALLSEIMPAPGALSRQEREFVVGLTRLADRFGMQADPRTPAAASGGPPLQRAT